MLTGQSTNQLELKINKAKISSVAAAHWEIVLSISSPSKFTCVPVAEGKELKLLVPEQQGSHFPF